MLIKARENCVCGREHKEIYTKVVSGNGCLAGLPDEIRMLGMKRPLVIADPDTYEAAGKRVVELLSEKGVPNSLFVFRERHPMPHEKTVGELVMSFPAECDGIVAVGSGVINDTCKIVSAISGKKFILVATAPSMDGFASATSSMELNGLKESLPSRTADVIFGDAEILKNAPPVMFRAGLGDMLAKYVSVVEWKISSIVTGEYYCEQIAEDVKKLLSGCVANAGELMKRDEEAVGKLFDALVGSGAAMSYAGCSRPASGIEHYFSHIWDMRSLEFGTPKGLHGIQCAIGTLYAIREYEALKKITPDREKAIKHAKEFDMEKRNARLREFLGKGAEVMIEAEARDRNFTPEKHKKRIDALIEHWDEILSVIDTLPSSCEIERILDLIGAPKSAREIGIDEGTLRDTFDMTRDVRFKYFLSHLEWDLGIECMTL